MRAGTGTGVLLWRRARVRTRSPKAEFDARWSNTSTTPSALRSLSLSVLRQSLKSPAMMTGSPFGADSITASISACVWRPRPDSNKPRWTT